MRCCRRSTVWSTRQPLLYVLGVALSLLALNPIQAQTASSVPASAGLTIEEVLAAKARRTPAQRKVGSQLLDAAEAIRAVRGVAEAATEGGTEAASPGGAPSNERVPVDIRADITPAVLVRIRALGGRVINSVPKYRAIRAELPLTALERLAELAEVHFIRPADEAAPSRYVAATGTITSAGDVAHKANLARQTHSVDGTGIGVGVLADGVDTLAARQASSDLPSLVTVLPGKAGEGDGGTALLEIVHDLAPGAHLYFATANGGQAQFAANIEALCEAGADVIVDDAYYFLEPALQDGVITQSIDAAVEDGCFYISAAGDRGNLNDGTSGTWEGDYLFERIIVHNRQNRATHDFGGNVDANRITADSPTGFVLQWSDPMGGAANDYDLFLVNPLGVVLASSTDRQSGSQDPIEFIPAPDYSQSNLSLRIVKVSGADRYLRLDSLGGRLTLTTAGSTLGHGAAEKAVSVGAVNAGAAGGSGNVFDATESVHTSSSDGPRRIFFEGDGTAITANDFSATGGKLVQKPDIVAATCVSTATTGLEALCGTSASAAHAAALAALVLEGAGGPANLTMDQLRAAMKASALDIEESGADRDSGAGIVMAGSAVDEVDVAVADRNGAPVGTGSLGDRTLTRSTAAVTIDLATKFSDPDDDTLTLDVKSAETDRVSAELTGFTLSLTPLAPGRSVVSIRATDPRGLSAVRSFTVTVQVGTRDYDVDNDNLIDVGDLAQLDALRYDLDGNGEVDVPANTQSYYAAFLEGAFDMGCPAGCTGYELTADLDFDGDSNTEIDANDIYWNNGAGWQPIGAGDDPFAATFDGGRHSLKNLFINRPDETGVGLFGGFGSDNGRVDEIRDVRLVNVDVTGHHEVGSLVGAATAATIIRCSASGSLEASEPGEDDVDDHLFFIYRNMAGGLIGEMWASTLSHSYSTVSLSGWRGLGGLVGATFDGSKVVASYATGSVSALSYAGALVGLNSSADIIASYATGHVSGGRGLVDFNANGGRIAYSYYRGNGLGPSAQGDLRQNQPGSIESSYWDTTVSRSAPSQSWPYDPNGTGQRRR